MTNIKRSLTFGDALKNSRPTAFSTILKPVGSLCNMDCNYCYYLDKAELYAGGQPLMSLELLELYIKQYIEANDVPSVTFVWHGGEPLLAGVDYYHRAVEFQNQYKGAKQIVNTIQTNGLLVDRQWCDFWRENGFLVGISIDGPRDIHDSFRCDKGRRPTFDRVVAAVELMARSGVEYNTLTTINSHGEGRGAEVYGFLKSIGSRYMQFLPVVEHVLHPAGGGRPHIVPPATEGAQPALWSVSADGFGQFMNDVFDCWVVGDVGNYFVQLFDVALAQWVGVSAGLCSFSETCGDALVVEHNGDVYSCDHFVYPQHRLGNIATTPIKEMLLSEQQFSFGINKRNSLPSECLRCGFYFACRGECPKHRFGVSQSGEKGLNVLCDGYKAFFAHIDPYMQFMAQQLANAQPPSEVMWWARQRMGLV